MTDDQKAMKKLFEAHCRQHGISLIWLLSHARRVDEPLGDVIERVYRQVEQKGSQ